MCSSFVYQQDMFSISTEDILVIYENHPQNIRTLVVQGVSALYEVTKQPQSVFSELTLACVRILTRVIPFLIEKGDEPFVNDMFWNEGHALLLDYDVKQAEEDGEEDEDEEEKEEPLAVVLISSIYRLLFLPGFTVDANVLSLFEDEANSTHDLRTALLWAGEGGLVPHIDLTPYHSLNNSSTASLSSRWERL